MEILQPILRFPGFEDKWAKKNLGSIFTITSASRVHKNEWTESGVRFFRSSDVVSHFKGNDNTKAYISFELYESLSNKIGRVKKGDILITGGGSIGIPYLISDNEPLYFKDADLLWIKNIDQINGYFLYSFFLTESFKNHLKSISHIGTIAHYTVIQAKNTLFNFPSLVEQTCIANFLSSVDEKLNLLKEKKALLQDYKKGIIQKIFNQEIRFKDDNGNDFGNWKNGVLSSVFNISTGKSKSDYIEKVGKYIIVDMGGISSNCKLIAKKYTNYNKDILNIGDLIMPKDDIGDGLIIGKTIVINENDKYILGDHVYKLVLKAINFNPVFFSYYINSEKINIELRRKTNGTAQISLNKDSVYEQPVLIPDGKEQTKIANFLTAIDEKIELVSNQIQDTQEYKKGLLQQMFV
jgi:type I restriction enzyme S subunit